MKKTAVILIDKAFFNKKFPKKVKIESNPEIFRNKFNLIVKFYKKLFYQIYDY